MFSATSTTKSPRTAAPSAAFATLRFSGDRLDPDQISAILHVRPTTAYRKGERYYAGSRTGHLEGRTGIWLLATDDVIKSPSLDRHLDYLISLIFRGPGEEDRLAQLQALMAKDGITADVSCFWHGNTGEHPPAIPIYVAEMLHDLPADIETDFDTD
jgi:Domain of unknown function (DUF4279)